MNLADLFSKGFSNLTEAELRQKMAEWPVGGYTLLDVRQPKEYIGGHIPGAILIPLPELPDRLNELDPEKPVAAY